MSDLSHCHAAVFESHIGYSHGIDIAMNHDSLGGA